MKMKLFFLLMFGGMCSGDLLNIGYLPPPGAKISGGSDGDLDVPLDTPFETPQKSFQRKPIQGSLPGRLRPEDQKTYGTTPSGFNEEDNFTAGTQSELVNVPTTTTSFAFTQTTTFSPLNEIQCNEPHCISSNQFPTSLFPVENPTWVSQKISNTQPPQSNIYNSTPQFQSPSFGSNTSGPFSNTYGTTIQPNQDSIKTQVTLDTKSPNTQSYIPGSVIGSFQPYLNESYRPPFKQFTGEKENYLNNFPATSALPQFTSRESILPTGTTVSSMSSFNLPRFDTKSPQYPSERVTENIPAKVGQPRDKYLVPTSFPSTISPKIFSQQPIIPSKFPNFPTSGASAVIPTVSPEGFTTGGEIQYPSPVGSTTGSNYNEPPKSGSIQPAQAYYRSKASYDINATILKYDNIITPEGYFSYSFDTSNGIHADESGDASDGVKAEGAYSYTGDDGQFYSITYTADENGYQPKGEHLPTPPPIPEAIQRVIDQSARDKAAGIIPDQGLYNEDKYGYKKYEGKIGQDSPITTDILGEIGSDNFSTRRPIIPGRRPSNEGIFPNLSQLSGDQVPDVSFSQTTVRPTYSNKYNIPDQGIDRKIGSTKPSKYLPEYSTSPTIYEKPFDYKTKGIPTPTGEYNSQIRSNVPLGQYTPGLGSGDMTEQGVPSDKTLINTFPNLTESLKTSTPNLFGDTRKPSKIVRPIQKYDQFGRPVSNNVISTPNNPINIGKIYEFSGRPIDEINHSITLNEGKIPERILDKHDDRFIQTNGPSAIRDGMSSEQGNYGRVQVYGGPERMNTEDFIGPVVVKYENGIYRDQPQIISVSSSDVTTLRPTSSFTDNRSRIPSPNKFVKGEDSTYKLIKEPQEFYQKNNADKDRFPSNSEEQIVMDKVTPGDAVNSFVATSSSSIPQSQQTNAIVKPFDRTMTQPNLGYKYDVPSQRFYMEVSQKYQPGKVTSFDQGPVSETIQYDESASTIAPMPSGIVSRPIKKPSRPSPGSAELFNITPDTLDTTASVTYSPLSQYFNATSSTSKPVTTSRGSIRYKSIPSEVSTIIPDGNKLTFSEPSRSTEVGGKFVTSNPEYNQLFYQKNETQPGTTSENIGIYGTAPTLTYGEDLLHAQSSTPKAFNVPETKPPNTHDSQFQFSTSEPEYTGTSLGFTQDFQQSTTFKPLVNLLKPQRPSQTRVSEYPTTQGSKFTNTGPTQYIITSKPGYHEQSTFTPTTTEKIYSGENQRLEQEKSGPVRQRPGYLGSNQQIPQQFLPDQQKHEQIESGEHISEQFGSDQRRPEQFGFHQQKPGKFESHKMTGQQRPQQCGSEQKIPGQYGLEQPTPGKFGLDQQGAVQLGSKQQRPIQFGLDQKKPGEFGSEQQIPGQFGLDQQGPVQFGSDQQRLGQIQLDRQKSGQFGSQQQKPGQLGIDQIKQGEFGSEQQIPAQFGLDQQRPEQFKSDHQRPGKFELEQQKSMQFGSQQQRLGQIGVDQDKKIGLEQQRPGQYVLYPQRPLQFGSDQQTPGQIELNRQKSGQFGSEQQKPGQFGIDQDKPREFVSEQQRPGQFGREQQKSGPFGSQQQRPEQFGVDQDQADKFGSLQQRPGQFGSYQQTSGQIGLGQEKPGNGIDYQKPGKFGSVQQKPEQFGSDDQRPDQFGLDRQKPGQFGSRVSSFPKVKGEMFSPSRKPPSFDPETGYHY